MIDFHAHFLPRIDDGAKDSKTSIKMLKAAKNNGVETIVATPHFYCDGSSIDTFLQKRKAAYEHLMKKVKEQGEENNIPKILLGCEVHLSISLGELKNIEKLCIEGSNCILLEMPYRPWQPWMFDMVYSIAESNGITPVMAHIERYKPINKSFEAYQNLFNMNVLGQVNAESFTEFGTRRFISKLVSAGYVQIIGSDMHNMTSRPPINEKMLKKIKRKFGEDFLENLDKNAKHLFGIK